MERLERGDPRGVGRYRILARVAVGGMATVYLGRSRGGRMAAVKVPHADCVREPGFRARFSSEVAAATAVGGTYSPPVLDADPHAATPWMATEFLPSVTLRHAVERFGPLPTGSVWRLAAGLAEALAATHRTGIVHLDVKPANVLLTTEGPRLIDFGIAARAKSTGPAGSQGFMSPEQVAGDAGPPSDIYSLGATLEHARDPHHTDEKLSVLIAGCRRHEAAARPTAAELTDVAAAPFAPSTPGTARPDAAWLPPAVVAAIDTQASAATNPPMPRSQRPPRRALLVGGAAAAAATGSAGVLLTGGDGKEPPPERKARSARKSEKTAPPDAASSTPSPSATPVTLTFEITGDGPLTSLTYWVNGQPTALEDTQLPWRRKVEAPRAAGSVDWRLRFTLASGTARVRVLSNGSRTTDRTFPVEAALDFPDLYPYDVDMGGSTAVSGPVPGADAQNPA